MINKQLTILILLAGYVVTIVALTIYHAFNFSDYVHWKGDETINYTFFLLLTSVALQVIIWMIVKTIDWKAVILATIANFIFSFIVGFGILTALGLSGIPKHLIFVYGGCYMTFFTIVTFLQINRLKARNWGADLQR